MTTPLTLLALGSEHVEVCLRVCVVIPLVAAPPLSLRQKMLVRVAAVLRWTEARGDEARTHASSLCAWETAARTQCRDMLHDHVLYASFSSSVQIRMSCSAASRACLQSFQLTIRPLLRQPPAWVAAPTLEDHASGPVTMITHWCEPVHRSVELVRCHSTCCRMFSVIW
jgi:hypothetical protein